MASFAVLDMDTLGLSPLVIVGQDKGVSLRSLFIISVTDAGETAGAANTEHAKNGRFDSVTHWRIKKNCVG